MYSAVHKALFVMLFSVLTFLGKSQLGQGMVSSEDAGFSHQYTFIDSDFYYFIDTTFNSLHWYHQFNGAGEDIFGYSQLGNIGAPLNLLKGVASRNIWGYFNHSAFDSYFLSLNEIPFYQTRSPLTEANYWAGYERGQYFNIYHTQNINKHWNFLVKYSRLSALGFYTHNRNKESSFLVNTNYVNKEHGYALYAYFLSEKMEVEEFGGIQNDSLFESNGATAKPRTLLNVNLSDDLRVMRSRKIYLDQNVALNRIFKSKASKQDSTEKQKAIDRNLLAVGHTFLYSRQSGVYSGLPSDGFYDSYYFDMSAYKDSTSYSSYENTVYLKGRVGRETKLEVKLGIKNLMTKYESYTYRFSNNNWGITGNLRGKVLDLFDVDAAAEYIASGALKESLDAGVKALVKLPWKSRAFGGYSFSLINPLYRDQFYYSNNFIWQNDFKKEQRNRLYYGVKWGRSNRLEFSHLTGRDFVYYSDEATPVQSENPVKLFMVSLEQNFKFWNFLHQDNNVVYQQVSGNTMALQRPEWLLRNSIYFEFPLFKGALKCLAGAELNYFSAYESPSYNPALGVFYNAHEKVIGNYPLVDVFANFEIRKARIFVKYEHVNEGLNGYTYYAAPHYPLADRVLRVGVTWRFFN